MAANESLFGAVLQALPIQMAILDQRGTIIYVNEAWQSFARENGAPALAETSVGLNYLTVCDQAKGSRSELAAVARAGIAAVLAGALPLFTLEYPCHSPDEQRWFLLYAAPLRGKSEKAVVAHLNITERKLLEEQVSADNREISDFLSLVSHEVRIPLTSINGHVQLAQLRLQRLQTEASQKPLSSESLELHLTRFQQSLERVETQTLRLNRLITDLGQVAQIQSDRLSLYLEPCDLVRIVWEAVEEQQLAWPTRNIELRLPEQAVPVKADWDRIGQVITNYLTNALKYAPADCPITVSLSQQADWARVQVRDRGPGVPAEEQKHIWERFYRIPGTQAEKESAGNLGMGLYICRSIIAQHGGQTGVESSPGAGATFWFTLPLDQPARAIRQSPNPT